MDFFLAWQERVAADDTIDLHLEHACNHFASVCIIGPLYSTVRYAMEAAPAPFPAIRSIASNA